MTGTLPSVVLLSKLAIVAAGLTLARSRLVSDAATLRATGRAAAIAVAAQSAHFLEELATGFHERFPAAFGQPPISLPVFVSFNAAWLVAWTASAWGIARRHRVASFPLWFLAVASIANGIAHPLLAVNAVGYFPGLVTSPLVAVTGFVLIARLTRATAGTAGTDARPGHARPSA